MKKQLLGVSCAVLLSLMSCKHKHEIDPKSTAKPMTNPLAEPIANEPSGPALKLVAIPDANFRASLKKKIPEAFKGDQLNVAHEKVKKLTEINVQKNDITDLKGIEFFTSLTNLNCSYNKLTSLDVSQNKALESLDCGNNELTSLDLSQNIHLKHLVYAFESKSSTLKFGDVKLGDVPGLRIAYPASGRTIKLVAIPDARFRAYLQREIPQAFIDFSGRQLLNTDHTKVKSLERISTRHSGIKDFTGIEYLTKLNYLNCTYNKLTSLNVSRNKALKELDCAYNFQLSNLLISGNRELEKLYCESNKLESLDVSQNTALKALYCWDNRLTSLDVSQNTALKKLSCWDNQLTSLDVSQNGKLAELDYCGNPKLTSDDVELGPKPERLSVTACDQ